MIRGIHNTLFASDSGVVAGFIATVLLMMGIAMLGIVRMHDMQQRLDSIVDNHVKKARLISTMRVAARERTLSLHKIIYLSDAFERDEEWMTYNSKASHFIKARAELVSMELTDREIEVLARQSKLTGKVVPMQDQVVDLAQADERKLARELLLNVAIPIQDQVLAQLDILSELQQSAAIAATAYTREQYARTRHAMIALSVIFIAISILVAIMTSSRSRRDRESLRDEKEKAQVTLHSMGEAVITTDANGIVDKLNAVALTLLGKHEDEVKGKHIDKVFTVIHDSTYKPAHNPVTMALENNAVICSPSDIILRVADSADYAVEATASPILGENQNVLGAVLVFRDVTEMRIMSHELGYQARHDQLTGLYNRREFEERLGSYLESTHTTGAVHSLCYLDLDNFKIVNDTCGHAAGDELLRQLGSILKQNVRRTDIIARLGGDEFGVIAVDSTSTEACRIADNIRNQIRAYRFKWDGNIFEIGTSIGIVEFSSEIGSIYDLLRAADFACYTAKDLGKNQVQIYSPEDSHMARREGEMGWVQRINHALEQQKFCLYVQKISSLHNRGHKQKYEVLVRMTDDEGRLILPSDFLPAAERYNLVVNIDQWVISQSFDLIASLSESQLDNIDCININLSGPSVSDPSLYDYIYKASAERNVSLKKVCFEITETAAIANLGNARNLITELNAEGCRFALDDFGAGLSSFGYLRSLPVEYVKIDGVFVRDMAIDAADLAMVKSIHQMAHAMGVQTVAEWIENPDVYDLCRDIGIDYGQGNAIAKPELVNPATLGLEKPAAAKKKRPVLN